MFSSEQKYFLSMISAEEIDDEIEEEERIYQNSVRQDRDQPEVSSASESEEALQKPPAKKRKVTSKKVKPQDLCNWEESKLSEDGETCSEPRDPGYTMKYCEAHTVK